MFIQPHKIALDSRFRADPYPVYALLRNNRPICPFPTMGDKKAWLVTRYEDVVRVLRDERFVRDIGQALTPTEIEPFLSSPAADVQIMSKHLLNRDQEEHGRIRQILNRAFAPAAVQPLRSRLEELALECISPQLAIGHMDLLADFAFPFTVTVIGEILGLPPQARISTRTLLNEQVHSHFKASLEAAIAQRVEEPKNDLITELVKVYQGKQLTNQELLDNLLLIFIAGHETTMNMIGNSVITLLCHREEWERLCRQLEAVPEVVDELMRYNGSVEKAWVRWATMDVALGDVLIRKGDQVYVVLASANRDITLFEEAESFCPQRPNSKRHLAFGYGLHYCAGAALGRLELEVALQTLLRYTPGLRLTVSVDELSWLKDEVMRGVQQLPVGW
jgi:cytochrome P450